MKSRRPGFIVLLPVFVALASSIQLMALKHHSATGPASPYSSLLRGTPQNMSAMVQSIDSNGTVVVKGVQPAKPSTRAWEEGPCLWPFRL